jgi:hypothetical protein
MSTVDNKIMISPAPLLEEVQGLYQLYQQVVTRYRHLIELSPLNLHKIGSYFNQVRLPYSASKITCKQVLIW